jgi:SAM-dependent methyltransferase
MDMQGINIYWQQLSPEDIEARKNRDFVGGLWDEIGQLQFDFLKAKGLLPHHNLLDIGCGCLRAGVKIVPYLNDGHYYGLDINASLLEAGKVELANAGIEKTVNLLVDDSFNASQFGVKFDFAIAQSVFTHIHANLITHCLAQVRKVLRPDGKFFATFFEAPYPAHIEPVNQVLGPSFIDHDPFHYSFEELKSLARFAGLKATYINNFDHPRGQKMICFTLPESCE